MLEKLFKLKENKTTVKTEITAGITTFMTMAYILAVNPSILSTTGMDSYAILMATALAAFLGTMLMAFLANYPFALAPGMGLNATFAYTVCLATAAGGMGISWQVALFAVFIEGIIFIILSLTNVREAIFNSIPTPLKHAVSVGIGLFIAFLGLQDAGVIVDSATLVGLTNFTTDFRNTGLTALLALAGVLLIAILLIKKVKGGILIGIFGTWIIGMILEGAGFYTPSVSCIPSFTGFHLDALGKTFGKCFTSSELSSIHILDFAVVIFTFLFVDMFDTLGTLIGVSSKANMLDKDGKLPRIKGALLADAIATSAGAVLGTSTTTTFVESASGVTEGGRTGLTAATTGFLFLLAIFFAPIFTAIPYFATAPALVIVGVYMMGSVLKINFNDFTDAVPAFLCIIAMPLTYSIAEGIFFGIISYTIINTVTGKRKEKKVSVLMYVLTILFICKYIFL